MLKKDELNDPTSCLSKSKDNEMVFVLRAHDSAAPDVIRYWVTRRLLDKKNHPGDTQISEALACASEMERQRKAGI
jgi:hypothetical protein